MVVDHALHLLLVYGVNPNKHVWMATFGEQVTVVAGDGDSVKVLLIILHSHTLPPILVILKERKKSY